MNENDAPPVAAFTMYTVAAQAIFRLKSPFGDPFIRAFFPRIDRNNVYR